MAKKKPPVVTSVQMSDEVMWIATWKEGKYIKGEYYASRPTKAELIEYLKFKAGGHSQFNLIKVIKETKYTYRKYEAGHAS